VIVVVALLGAATVLAYLDRVSWVFELGTFFRLQYAILLGLAGAVALACRRPVVALVAAALAALNVATIAPHWDPRHAGTPLGHDRVVLAFVNVDVSNHDHAKTIAWLSELHPDVVGVTELSPAWRNALSPVLHGYRFRVLHVQDSAYGIGLYSRRPVEGRIEHDPEPSVVASFRLDRRPVTLVVTHPHTPFGPHAGGLHQRQFRQLARRRPSWEPRALVCGDFNTPPWSGPLRDLMRKAHLADSHRGYGFESSWPTWAWPLRTPIDNCLVSPGLAVTARSRGPDVGSDHFPLVVELAATRLDQARTIAAWSGSPFSRSSPAR
jgi:endonuclease/exonuclease/phosphatase (EEP) superfamily protein YafD